MKTNANKLIAAGIVWAAWLGTVTPVFAHCDTMDGPVVRAAKTALAKQEITPVLKWIKPEHEAELTTAFTRTLAVRPQSKEARELADQFFFETLVRLHRAGEGAPYTGLKPAGTKLEPAVEAADNALDHGRVDTLVKTVTEEAATGIRKRFTDAVEKHQHAEHNVEAGRAYVAAYVEFVHYVEALHATASRGAQGHGPAEQTAPPAAAVHPHNH